MNSNIEQLFDAFNIVNKPTQVKGCVCCISDEDMIKVLNYNQKSLRSRDLLPYITHVLLTIGSKEDFTYLLPAILKCWAEELHCNQDSDFIPFLQPALIRNRYLHDLLPTRLRQAVMDFMCAELLNKIGAEKSLTHVGKSPTPNWFSSLASFGVLSDRLPSLWKEWWDMPTEGHAISAVQYASCLICDEEHNPVFVKDKSGGGGAPSLWEQHSYPENERWLQGNVDFISKILSVDYLNRKLSDAMVTIKGNSNVSVVKELQQILEKDPELAKHRIKELIEIYRLTEFST